MGKQKKPKRNPMAKILAKAQYRQRKIKDKRERIVSRWLMKQDDAGGV